MKARLRLLKRIQQSLSQARVTALLGPRQSGKTTLARFIAKQTKSHYWDLENPSDEARLQNPLRALENLRGLVILDEIQRQPSLFNVLRVLADRKPQRAKFLILGSASPDLIRNSSESLAGRARYIEVGGFELQDVGLLAQNQLWLRGGFPPSFLAPTTAASYEWRDDFIQSYLERDIPQLGIRVPALTLRRFWTMIAHNHGQIWNGSAIGTSLGLAHTTTRHYLDILSGAFLVRQLPPWHENLGKRVVKSPKVYVRDSGLLHSLLRLPLMSDVEAHLKFGSSWEGFALEQILALGGERDAHFWGTHAGAELDLLVHRKGKRWGFEFKAGEAPRPTKSMHIAIKDLRLEHLWVVYPGKNDFPLFDKADCIGLSSALKLPLWK